MRTVVLISCVLAALAQKDNDWDDWKKDQDAWWNKVSDKCMENKGPFRCKMNFSVGCEWHDDKGVCYNEEFWAQKLKENGANSDDCKAADSEAKCDKLSDKCEWHDPKKVCYNKEGFKKRQETEAQRGAGCWTLTDLDVCKTREDCLVDSGKCKVKGGCWAQKSDDDCAKNDKCTWVDEKCMSLEGFMKTGGTCAKLGKASCGNARGCIWLLRPGGVGYCGRTDECRAQTEEADCKKLGDDCYWVTLKWNGKSICRPSDGVQCAQQEDADSCEKHSEACIWAERKGGEEGCMREDLKNDPEKTPCIKAESKRECDQLSDDLNCGWTTQFGYGREVMGATGRCLHLDCAEIDEEDTCEENWQCRWNSRRRTCVTDEAVHCDFNTQAQCNTQDECRWIWSENRDSYFCQSVCLIADVRRSAPLCRTFETCSWAVGWNDDYTCRIAAASMDKTACISANDVEECAEYDDNGLGCFWDTDRNDCYHESCETYQTEEKCEGNYQCKWLLGRKICRSMQTWWCNGNDMEACEEAPSCKWVAFENREGRQVFGCRHECTMYESQELCVNDDACFWSNGRPVQQGQQRGRWHEPGCRARAQDDDSSACAHQYSKDDCDTFAIAASVGCGWMEPKVLGGKGACVHEACFDHDKPENCNKDKYCKWVRPMGRDGMCASPQAYWCKGGNKDSCEAAGRDCSWMQVGDDSDKYTCRHSCWAVKNKEECNNNDECSWGWNPRTKQGRCFFVPMNYDGGVMVDDACVDLKDEDSCDGADEKLGCGWLEQADFGEGGDAEGRMRQPGCRHIDCFQLDNEDDCEDNLQCEWHGMRKECFSPIDYHCREIADQIRCNALTGCAWNAREVVFPSGKAQFFESCTSSCKVIRNQQNCDLVKGCSWASGGRAQAQGRCLPDPEESLDQTFCNERGNKADCMLAPAKMDCVWQYAGWWKTFRCMHAACKDAETKDACDAIDQCRWGVGADKQGRCYAPAKATEENPCMTLPKDDCEKMEKTCNWALTEGGVGRCLMTPDDDEKEEGPCNEQKSKGDCEGMAEAKKCAWLEARKICIFEGCRNLLAKDKCVGQDQCEWVWRTAAQMARFGKKEGSWGCRSKPFCNKETCKAPLCMQPGIYLDENEGCCGRCVPDNCSESDLQNKQSCKKGKNCKWNKKDKECASACPEISDEMAQRECMQDGLMRAIVEHPTSGCDVSRCVRPETYCKTIDSKKQCSELAKTKLCEWKGSCIQFGGKVDCEELGRKDCRAAGKDCLHVQALDKCMAVSTICEDMTSKEDCKALSKAHRKANEHFGGCDFDAKKKKCMKK